MLKKIVLVINLSNGFGESIYLKVKQTSNKVDLLIPNSIIKTYMRTVEIL